MKTTKLFYQPVVSLLIILVAVTGCAPATMETSITPSATILLPTETQTQRPTETPIPTDTATPFVPKATIKIASHSPLSGDQASGTDIMRGPNWL
jgi:hypothetical protein